MGFSIPEIPASVYEEGLFIHDLTPIGGSLVGSFFVGLIPLLLVLVLLGVFRLPAYLASLSGLIVCIFVAIFGWRMPAQQAFESVAFGLVFANWPIMWIVVNAIFIYNLAVESGIFDIFRRWMITHTPPDTRILLLIIGYCFGALLEGVAGFGTPGAICSPLLISLGFDPVDALVYTLIFDTTPVAFGALGIAVTTLSSLTGLPVMHLSAMMGRQLPLLSLLLPLYAVGFYAGFRRGIIECWPAAMVAGVSFAVVQCVFANLVGPELPDLIAGLASLLCLVGFVQFWKPPYHPEFKAAMHVKESTKEDEETTGIEKNSSVEETENTQWTQSAPSTQQNESSTVLCLEKPSLWESILAWSPWIIIVIVVIIWTFAGVDKIGQMHVEWPHLHHRVWLTLYGKPYDAIWTFQPLATGTALLIAAIPFSVIVLSTGAPLSIFYTALRHTLLQLYMPTITVSFIMAFAYLFNYSGMVYSIGLLLASVGKAFPFLSAWLGWLGCFLSGSDTSANSLFGNLQVVAAREIGLSAVLMASTNSCGAITSKMISPQNLSTGVSTIGLKGQEGRILRRTILHSLFMVCLVGVITCVQQYAIPGMIPS
ncbi:lactate permease [Spinellus fusiger]|nr:lactate permease [Spinellus fusiger]